MAKKETAANRDAALREHLVQLLTGGHAHATFDKAIKNLPVALRGKRPKGAEHSPWEVLEHLRIAQWDILEFSRNAEHQSPAWPSGYWPATPAPPDEKAWDKSVRAFRRDLKAMCELVANPSTDLYARIPHGDDQTILREALLAADHNAYHLGELVLLRRLLGAW
ncbi:MAG: DinB family protein [Terracidiphilus sp.]